VALPIDFGGHSQASVLINLNLSTSQKSERKGKLWREFRGNVLHFEHHTSEEGLVDMVASRDTGTEIKVCGCPNCWIKPKKYFPKERFVDGKRQTPNETVCRSKKGEKPTSPAIPYQLIVRVH